MVSISQMRKSKYPAQGHTGRPKDSDPVLTNSTASCPRIDRILSLDLPLPVAYNVKSSLTSVLRETQQSQGGMWKWTGHASEANFMLSLLIGAPRLCSFYILPLEESSHLSLFSCLFIENIQRQLNPLFLTGHQPLGNWWSIVMVTVPYPHLVNPILQQRVAELMRAVLNNHPHPTNPKSHLWEMVRVSMC